jgi:hypothetical protein
VDAAKVLIGTFEQLNKWAFLDTAVRKNIGANLVE